MKKIENPVCIRLNEHKKYILIGSMVVPLKVDTIVNGSHYGIVLLVEDDSVKNYPTKNPITDIKCVGTILAIFEEGKKVPWYFDDKGNMINYVANEIVVDSVLEANEFRIKQMIKRNHNKY